jgi:hypothetical protein
MLRVLERVATLVCAHIETEEEVIERIKGAVVGGIATLNTLLTTHGTRVQLDDAAARMAAAVMHDCSMVTGSGAKALVEARDALSAFIDTNTKEFHRRKAEQTMVQLKAALESLNKTQPVAWYKRIIGSNSGSDTVTTLDGLVEFNPNDLTGRYPDRSLLFAVRAGIWSENQRTTYNRFDTPVGRPRLQQKLREFVPGSTVNSFHMNGRDSIEFTLQNNSATLQLIASPVCDLSDDDALVIP